MKNIKACDMIHKDYPNSRFNFDLSSKNKELINIEPEVPYKEGDEIYILHFNLNKKTMEISTCIFDGYRDIVCYYNKQYIANIWYVAPKTNKGYEHLIKIAEIIVQEYKLALLDFVDEISQGNIEALKKLKMQAFR